MAGVNDGDNHTEGGQLRPVTWEFIIWRSFFFFTWTKDDKGWCELWVWGKYVGKGMEVMTLSLLLGKNWYIFLHWPNHFVKCSQMTLHKYQHIHIYEYWNVLHQSLWWPQVLYRCDKCLGQTNRSFQTHSWFPNIHLDIISSRLYNR